MKSNRCPRSGRRRSCCLADQLSEATGLVARYIDEAESRADHAVLPKRSPMASLRSLRVMKGTRPSRREWRPVFVVKSGKAVSHEHRVHVGGSDCAGCCDLDPHWFSVRFAGVGST